MKQMLLQEGDVFDLEPGHTVYLMLPEHFCYDNREGVFDKCSQTEVVVGRDKRGLPTDWLADEYVVTSTAYSGGGRAMFNEVYPDGHLVKAEKLLTGGLYHRTRVSFYQSGSFTAMNPEIVAKAKATAHWSKEE